MKNIDKIIIALVLFVPMSISIYFGKNWQESLLLLLASMGLILLTNVEKYEIFKLSKDGIEIKTKMKKLDFYLVELKKNVVNLLNIQLDVINRLGNNLYGSYIEIKEIVKTIEQGEIEDPGIEEKVKIMRQKLIYSMIKEFEIQYSDLKRSKNPDHAEAKEIWLVLIKELIPNYTENSYDYSSYAEDFEVPSKEIIINAVNEYTTQMINCYPQQKERYIKWKKTTIEIINFSFTA